MAKIGQTAQVMRGAREIVLESLVLAWNVEAAAILAGVSTETVRRWSAEPAFILALHEARQKRLQTEGAAVGLKVMLELATKETTADSVRYSAAKTLLALGGHVEAMGLQNLQETAGRQALVDMDENQIRQVIKSAEAALSNATRPVLDGVAEPVTPDIPPENDDAASLL